MTIFRESVVAEFAEQHPDSRKSLQRFVKIVSVAEWPNFLALRQAFPNADMGRRTGKVIFDIRGNRYRLIAVVNFEKQVMSIESVLNHKEYDREKL